ncbi:MAG: DNA translocase FtsK 4TM domain-containing protein [Candidatus Aminicenantes bacterium]|nr:DNA translocase FtsK 4TM domain-containing protein [Candidatus Aminicenantes bacterium]
MKKKSKAALPLSFPRSRRKKGVRSSDIIGVILVFLAVFFFISLISYDSSDPSWTNTGWAEAQPSGQRIHNAIGKAGAYLSDALLQLFGFTSFLLCVALFYMGIQCFLSDEQRSLLLKSGGSLFLVLVFCSLLALLLRGVFWRGAEFQAGGLIGDLISSIMVRFFSRIGTLLILIVLLVLFFILATKISMSAILHFFSSFFQFVFKEVRIKVIHYQKSKFRERMRKKIIEKYSPPESEESKKFLLIKRRKEKKKKPELEPESAATQPAPPLVQEKFLFPEMEKKTDYNYPPFTLLDPGKEAEKIDKEELYEKKLRIEEKLAEFRVDGEVREYHPGPVVTTYEFYPHPGIKISQVASLSEDLSMALGAESARVQRMPGKSSLGVEIPNNRREIIKLRDILESEQFTGSPSKLTFGLGKTIHGDIYITDLAVMPHLLIAGATGTGKSVSLNSLIAGILYKAKPEDVKLILIDPKRLEFTLWDGIPHLLCPVVKDPKKAGAILMDTVKMMEERYQKLGLLRVRNIEQYNHQVRRMHKERKGKLAEEEGENLRILPYLVIIIDELAELMMIGAQDVEYCIARLAQLARAVGIHLVMATQRPSIDVITGTIKNNFSSRIAFRVPTKVDSRIIIDASGAEKLLGLGDMLFMPPNYPRLIRLHGSHISIPEITRLVKFVKEQGSPEFDDKIIKTLKSRTGHEWEEIGEKDELYDKALELVLLTGQASASYLQRKLKLGYARAARIIDQMEQEGIVGPSEGSKPREFLVDPQTYLERMKREE